MEVVVSLVIAYLLGTIPTAVVVARLFTGGKVDIRQSGSGNPGAMNTKDVLGKKAGVVVLIGDLGKAIAACVVARIIGGDTAADFAGSAAVIGHCFPVWTRFKGGGKGVACAGGQCWATFPVYTPVAMALAYFTSKASFASRAYISGVLASSAWVASAALWVVLGLPNAWGPKATLPLVLSAAISGGVMIYKFEAGRPVAEPVATAS